MSAMLAAETFDDWRAQVRGLLARGVPPHEAQWQDGGGHGDLLDGTAAATTELHATESVACARSQVRLPRKLVEMLEQAACCRQADRWAFLYRVVWRWQHGEHDVASAADADGARLHAMVKAVRREEHDMHAYVRFRERPDADGPPRFVAWFEPAHDVLPQVARHFVARMGKLTWMIATPDASALWDGETLALTGPLLQGPADIEDAGEALWLTYYRSIFNPARLNAGIMNSHVRARFWKHMPEGSQVPAMVADAATGARRTGQTVSVGERRGTVIPIAPERAQPQRALPTTLDECRRCSLWEHATQAVPGTGPRRARVMLIGEQPGDQEDLAGLPFIGPAGQVLDSALREAGLDRGDVYVTNAVKHFKWEPRGKRRLHKTPAQQEVAACRHWLEEEMASVAPDIVVTLGATALKAVLRDDSATLAAHLGQPFRHEGRWIVAVYHPSFVLRAPDSAQRELARAVITAGLQEAAKLLADGEQVRQRER